jgi:hypothetical protein
MPSQTGRQLCRALFGVAALMLVAGCGTFGFDPAAYQATVQLKYDTLGLIDQSSGRYPPHRAAADTLLRRYAEASEAASRNVANESISRQWAAIRDPRGNSAANLIEMWKRAPLRPGQRAEKKRAIAAHFDRLICLEGGKHTPTECGDTGAIEVSAEPAPVTVARPVARRGATPKPAAAEEPEMEIEPQKE